MPRGMLDVEVRSSRTDHVSDYSEMGIHPLADHLSSFGGVDRGNINRRTILPLRFALE